MSANEVQVFVAVFDNVSEAKKTLEEFKAMQNAGSIDLIDAAVVVRQKDGKVKFDETADPGAKTWGKRGAVVGGVLGLIFPPSLIVSAGLGGGAGAIWGKLRDKGIADKDLEALGESMEPGSSAVVAIAQDRVIEQLQTGLEGYRRLARHSLSAEAAFVITDDELSAESEKPLAGSTSSSAKGS